MTDAPASPPSPPPLIPPATPTHGDQLSASEAALVSAIKQGRRARLEGATVRAWVIRDLAIEIREDWSVQPAGIRVYDARIEGQLDLEGCAVAKPLLFFRCTFGREGDSDEPLQFRDARLRRLGLYECTIHGGLKADRTQIESAVFMQRAVINGRIRMRGIEIGGSLGMEEVVLSGAPTALVLDNAKLGGPWLLRGARIAGEVRLPGARITGGVLAEAARFENEERAVTADGVRIEGPLVMTRSHVTGRLQARAAEIKGMLIDEAQICAREPAINAEGALIDGEWSMTRARIEGGLTLSNTRILGRLNGDGVRIETGHHAFTGGGLVVRQGVRMNGARLKGGMRIDGADIGKAFMANKLVIQSRNQAFSANVIRIGGDWIMRGAEITGSMRFPGARIEGQLALTESRLDGGVLAIRADGSRIRGGWFMGRATVNGRVRFPASEIGNQVRFSGSTFNVLIGPAIVLNATTIKRDLVLSGGLKSNGAITFDQCVVAGTVDLRDSTIQSALIGRDCAEMKTWDQDELIERYDHIALSLVDARIDRLQMPEKPGNRPRGVVDLSRADVGTFEDFAAAWPPGTGGRWRKKSPRATDQTGRDVDHLVLDGFSYEFLENPAGLAGTDQAGGRHRTWNMRVKWLGGQSSIDLDDHFKPQAWVQLSRRLSAQGFHEDARQISIARRRRHRQSASVRRRVQLQSYLLDLFALFGFNPWRTIAWMGLFVGLFAAVWLGAARACALPGCADESVFVRSDLGRFSANETRLRATYPEFNALAYSFDLFIPVINFGYQDLWRPNLRYGPFAEITLPRPGAWFGPTLGLWSGEGRALVVRLTWGGVLHILYILEMIVGLVLTSLAVTGFTGLLRREE